jgi:hypothetical protein
MHCTCFIVPRDVLERLAHDPELSAELRDASRRTLATSVELRQMRAHAVELSRIVVLSEAPVAPLASAPAITRNTEPSTTKPDQPLLTKNLRAWCGLNAPSTAGCRTIPPIPSAAIATIHSTMMGPKILPTVPVPRLWREKRPIKITIVMGTM